MMRPSKVGKSFFEKIVRDTGIHALVTIARGERRAVMVTMKEKKWRLIVKQIREDIPWITTIVAAWCSSRPTPNIIRSSSSFCLAHPHPSLFK